MTHRYHSIVLHWRAASALAVLSLAWLVGPLQVQANPVGGTVTQGAASFNTSGSQLTINQTSGRAFINWQSFNIAPVETTTFNQPSSSSVTWNYINDPNASSINGNLNANGYVILQNPNGFTVGGSAAISAHGLVMTTASTPNLNLSSGGAWAFDSPPPTAQIVNYGHINISGGGSAYLIASDIVNNGTISAPNGKIGLYAGQQVLVSLSPDGRGLSAQITLPQGSVDNNGNLIADAGSIAAQAQFVNQSGLVQANSAQNVNGTIELVAGDTLNLNASSTTSAEGSSQAASAGGITLQAGSTINNNGQVIADGRSILMQAATVNQNGILRANSLGSVNGVIELAASGAVNLGASSDIEAHGDNRTANTSASPGGSVTIKSDNSFSDQAGSTINISGGAQGGNGGQLAVSAPQMSALQSSLNGQANAGYADGHLSIDTANMVLNSDGSLVPGALALNVNSLSSGFSQIILQAADNIELSSQWTLMPKSGIIGVLSLLAGNAITLDAGSKIEADAGRITLSAATVNQNGTLQANSLGNANGAVAIEASASLNLGSSSSILANGDSTAAGASPGGFVVLHGDNTFADTAGSTISVSGAQGGQNGIVEIFGSGVTTGTIKSGIGSCYALLINPNNLKLSTGATSTSASNPNLNLSALLNYSQICLYNIELASQWNLGNAGAPATLNLSALNNIILDNNSRISAGNNWDVNLTAGTGFVPTTAQPTPASGHDGIYINGVVPAFIQTQNGDINLWAANEVIIVSGAIRTIGGGNIDVTAEYGDVNSGNGINGFNYLASAPYFTPASSLSGISTAAGGNVTINAGGDVTSFPTTTVAAGDPGSGAFGSQPGNVTINAGGSVYGHFVEVNGTGTINAGQNIGTGPTQNNPNITEQDVALSLVTGSWNLNAGWDPVTRTVQNGIGNIYLQEVRNPNGVFNSKTTITGKLTAGYHLFDYDPQASVTLTAGNGVYLTGYELPRPNGAVPMLLPPTLIISAGSGGVTLETPSATDGGTAGDVSLSDFDITLFPSAYGNLQITTTDGGGLSSGNADGSLTTLLMSDSSQTHWFDANTQPSGWPSGLQPFGENDHASIPAELNNNNPVVLNISGTMENVILQVCKLARITVGGDLIGCTFFGENLRPNDVTSITVGGQIDNASSFNQVNLADGFPSLPVGDLPPGMVNAWYLCLELAVDPSKLPTQSLLNVQQSLLASYLTNARMFLGISPASNLAYDPITKTLTAVGPLSPDLQTALEQPTLTFVKYGPDGYPLIDTNPQDANYGHFETETINWVPANSANASLISSLGTASLSAPPLGVNNGGYVVGGTGAFDITANSISLGNSDGILSVGNGHVLGRDYSFLTPYITSGATINVLAGYLEMPSSTIATLGGGNVNVTCTGVIPNSILNDRGVGVSMDLGSQALLPFEAAIMNDNGQIGLGIYTSGGGNVNVTAYGTINIDSSRIATLAGGNIYIESLTGDVNAGSGGSIPIPVQSFSPFYSFPYEPVEYIFANGIVADTLPPLADGSLVTGTATLPGNITVITSEGSIYANLGGILQETLNGILHPGPSITLEAGTPAGGDWTSKATPVYAGDVILGDSGAIGGAVVVKATRKVSGLVISQQSANVNAQIAGNLFVLGPGPVVVTISQSIGPITIIGRTVDYTGSGPATLLGQTVSNNGSAATSPLGNSASATSTSQSAAGEASSEAQQQVASDATGNDDQKKNQKKSLIQRTGRVTVILPKAS